MTAFQQPAKGVKCFQPDPERKRGGYQKLLVEGRYASISDMAAGEKIERGYLGTLLRLTLLAPEMVEAILNGRQPEGVTLPRLLEGVPVGWGEQRNAHCQAPQ
jgi:hypothetical protein